MMNKIQYDFTFNTSSSSIYIQNDFPTAEDIAAAFPASGASPSSGGGRILVVCDRNTEPFARRYGGFARIVLPSGEGEKNWASVEKIMQAAVSAGLGRDALFLGLGGGITTDICAFAASIYMRSVRTAFIATTLLGMADAALGGKTGIDLFGVKNLAGTFFPAAAVWMPLSALKSLPSAQWKSGFAEIIKAAIIDEDAAADSCFEAGRSGLSGFHAFQPFFACGDFSSLLESEEAAFHLQAIIAAAVRFKGRIVEADPEETGGERAKLNLGHTFGHALEASAGLGSLSHGEAVAWGIARACALGVELNITPPERAEAICGLLQSLGYETRAPHPLLKNPAAFMAALNSDKKKKDGAVRFIIPARRGVIAETIGAAQMPLVRQAAGI
ncbi:MAG: 3-dehydroquinate synthase [Spirochaetaceae bacterium]|jgi:3-dehydroquinate synthase|nr:3-dehydroquinate synthase [Spirochaetaceae bacterium]